MKTAPSIFAVIKMSMKSVSSLLHNFLLIGLMGGSAIAQTVPDLTNGGVPDHTRYINLGPTGLTGWVYRERDPKSVFTDLSYTGSSRQIKVTAVAAGSPAIPAGILVNDVILGASGDGSAPGNFTSDARKSLALAIAAAEARTTPELKLKVWRAGVTGTYTLTLQNLGSYGPNAPVSDAKCALILENARQALMANSNPAELAFGTLALMAVDDPNHPNHAAMKARIDTEIASILPDAANLAAMNSGVTETADNRGGWRRGHKLIVLAEYYLTYGEHPNGGVLQAIQAHVNSVTTGQSIFGTLGHIYAQFRWPDDPNTPLMGGYGAINSSAVPALYGLLLAKQCNVTNPKLDECINRAVTFYGSYAGRGIIPYGEHEAAATEYSSNGKSAAAALLLDLVPGKEAEEEFFAKMSTAAYKEHDSGHTGSFFNHLWAPLGAAHAGDEAIKNYFAENSWLYDLSRRWDGSFAFNIMYVSDNYYTFNTNVPYVMTYALPLKRLHMTGRGRSAAGVLDATARAEAIYSGGYDQTTRTKAQLFADLADWSPVVHTRIAPALALMSLTAGDMDTLHALASDPQGSSREGALMALEKIADANSAPVLAAILSDPDPHIRRQAALALLANPAKATQLNTLMIAIAAAQRPTFPMDTRDPLHHDVARMAEVLGSILEGNLTGVDRQLLYPAVRAIAACPAGEGRKHLEEIYDGLSKADVDALADVMVSNAYHRSPADPMFADVVRREAMEALTRHDYAEVISIAAQSIRSDFYNNPNRGLYYDFFQDMQEFGATNLLVTPDPDVVGLCEDFVAQFGVDFYASVNAGQAKLLMDAIQADADPAAPTYLKRFNWVVADAATLTLPANQTQLHASVTDLAQGELSYSWRKVYGPGNVTFGSATSKDTTITFANAPGHYLFEVAVIDSLALSEIKRTVPVTLYAVGGTLPANSPPSANAQSLTTAPFTALPITLTGSDPEGQALIYTVKAQPLHGTLSGTAPNLTYLPDTTYPSGPDSFTFEVTDNFGQTASATVSITVNSSLLVTHVRESFNYTVGALLTGAAGGTGMTGTWLDGPDLGQAWIYDASTVTTPVNTGAGNYSWDGVVNTLPANYGGSAKMVGLAANSGGSSYEIHRPLAQNASAMAGADGVLWASIAYHRQANNFSQHLGFALSTDCFSNEGKALSTTGGHGSNLGRGIGVFRPVATGSSYCAAVFNGGSALASTTAPTFVNGDFVMVLKFEFGATDKVTAYAFREDEYLTEEMFNARAISASAAIDETTLNRITVASGRGDPSFDEIQIGDSFAAVIGLAESTQDVNAPTPDPVTFAVAPTGGASSISMTATTVTDPSGVEYYFTCTSGNGKDSGWQSSPSYSDQGLGAGTYSYTVKARDKSVNLNLTASSAPASATIVSQTPGVITWNVFNISGNVSDISTSGTTVSAHGGADLGTGDIVDGSTFLINGVTFDDGFVFDNPSHKDGLGSRCGTYTTPNAAYYTLMTFADRQLSGNCTFTFNNLTVGNTYQIQLWHGDNNAVALQNGLVVNNGGTVTTPAPALQGHATLLREISEGGYGQYALGSFVASSTTQQFLARAYGGLTTTPAAQTNTTINGCQLRMIAEAPATTPPTLASSNIVDDKGGAPVQVGSVVAYEVTFSKAMNAASISHADFSNAGTASCTIGTVAALSPTTYRISMHALSTGTLQLRVNTGAVITDLAGLSLDTSSAILDDTTITVVPANWAPVWTTNPVNEASASEDAAYSATLANEASDADSDPLTFAKISGPAWLSVAANGALTGTPTQADVGANSFTVSVSDGIAAPVEATLNITVINVNDAPVFAANPITGDAATEDSLYTATLAGAATDADGNSLTYAKISGPAWLNVAPDGTLSGTPTQSNVGANSFTVSVSDGIATAVQASLNITVANVNDAPIFAANPITGAVATQDTLYTATLAGSATDAESDPLTYAKVSGPAWLSVAPNGSLSGTPTQSNAGANSFTISVSDGIAAAVQATLNITVNSATPVIAYWDGGNGTWGDPTKWSTLSGATTPDPAVAPRAIDTAILNTISGGTTVQDVALDGDRAVNSLIFRSGTPNIVGNTTGTTARTLTLGTAGITINNTVAANFEIGRSPSTLGAVNIVLGSNQTWTNNDNNILTVNGSISGNAQLTLAGVGHFRLNGASSFNGGLIINGGTVLPTLAQVESFLGSATNALVTVNSPARLGLNRNTITGTMTLNGGTLDSTNSFASTWNGSTVLQSTSTMQGASGVGSLIINSVISGSGGLTKGAAGSLTLTNANTFTGDTISGVNTVSLFNLNHSLALQNSTLNTTSSSVGAASGGLQTNVTALTLGGLSGNKGLKSLFRTDATAGGYNNLAALTLNTGTGKTPAYSGSIANGASGMTLTKTGQGTQTLSGINTYTGATTVSQGNLALVGGSQASPITVASGASLGFTLDSPTSSTSSVNFGAGTIAITGTPTLTSYTLMTADGGFTGTPVLSAPVPGYELAVQGTQLKLLIPQSAPVWASNPITEINAAEDAAYSATLANEASDADSDPLTFTKISGPAWLSVGLDGSLSGTPTQSNVGANSFTVSVSDGIDAPVEATLNITVINVNDAPVFAANPITGVAATEDSLYTATLAGSATDADGNSLTYAKVSGPAWLSVAANGALSGTPTQSNVGANSFTVSVSDGIAAPIEATLNITVTNVNDAPVFTANPITGANATEDTLYTATLAGSATDAESDPLTYTKVSGPAWLSVAANGSITGTPSNTDVGANAFTVNVSDGTAPAVTASLNITVDAAPNSAPVFLTNPIVAVNGSEGTAYTGVTLAGSATDSDAGDTITFSKVSGPAWLAVAANGALSGTPPAGSTGLNSFVVRATDSASATVDATLQITVGGLPLPWLTTDIGTGMLAGSVTHNAGTFTQAGSGAYAGTSDKLRFTYQTLTGDGEITARITTLQNTGTSSGVGVTIRDSLATSSKHFFMGMSNSNSFRWVRRTTAGGSNSQNTSSTGTIPNTWVRIVRSGTTITLYKSTNGTTWTTVQTNAATTLSSTCYIGLVVSSGSNTTLNTSQISNVSVTP